jgi:hypothetical protein
MLEPALGASRAFAGFAQALRPCAALIWESMLAPSRGRNHMIRKDKCDLSNAMEMAEFWLAADLGVETYRRGLVLL